MDAGKTPVLYEVSVENIKILDLRKDSNVKKVMPGFRDKLNEKYLELEKEKNHFSRRMKSKINEAIDLIDNNLITSNNVRDAAYDFLNWFTDYVTSLGYEGLVSFEGGDGQIGPHDTYLIFDPKKIKINQEQVMANPTTFIRRTDDDQELEEQIDFFNTAENS